MKIISSPKQMQRYSTLMKSRHKQIGFVPTMGYLHKGHMSLVRRSVRENDITIVSIFVNPTQFGPKEDFDRYPRDFKRDLRMLKLAGVDVLFYPSVEKMYPERFYTYVECEYITDVLCGRFRPGHFRGVTTVVAKLFNITKPDISYFGQKDAQQAIVIKKMVEDLNMDVKIKVMPIVREKDGLAMSSRNTYLTPEERKDAVILYRALLKAKELVRKGEINPTKIKKLMRKMISQKTTVRKIEYIEIVNLNDLRAVSTVNQQVLIALAVWIGKTRLIDNIVVRPVH